MHVRSTDDSVLRQPALCTRALRWSLLGVIRLYQRFVSPALPVVTLGACACRFTPSCSHYAADAISTHGALAGLWLALRRLAKCTPLHPGGFDPVPSLPPFRLHVARRRVCSRTRPAA